jgi:hypothetical protein
MEDAPTEQLARQERAGGRRYRAGRPPPQRPSANDQPRVPAPYPSGFGALGTLGALFAGCLASCLLAAWLHLVVLAGVGFCAGSALAAWYCRRAALLRIVIAVPAVFAIAEILAQLTTLPRGGRHGLALPVAGGTLLTLAAVAPWLFAGSAAALAIAMFRGLPQCVRDLRTELRGRPPDGRGPRTRRGPPAEQALRAQKALRELNAQRAGRTQQAPRG